ncbi:unnamed protein product, partial [Mesorhabditis belari]|uniref:Uncharacterized protein n=1 Tax=Mesorhabditis belari TaxID=2138241 RepID=A0AAF3EK48_9BILA
MKINPGETFKKRTLFSNIYGIRSWIDPEKRRSNTADTPLRGAGCLLEVLPGVRKFLIGCLILVLCLPLVPFIACGIYAYCHSHNNNDDAACKVCVDYDANYLRRTIDSVKKRIEACIKADGGHFENFL